MDKLKILIVFISIKSIMYEMCLCIFVCARNATFLSLSRLCIWIHHRSYIAEFQFSKMFCLSRTVLLCLLLNSVVLHFIVLAVPVKMYSIYTRYYPVLMIYTINNWSFLLFVDISGATFTAMLGTQSNASQHYFLKVFQSIIEE